MEPKRPVGLVMWAVTVLAALGLSACTGGAGGASATGGSATVGSHSARFAQATASRPSPEPSPPPSLSSTTGSAAPLSAAELAVKAAHEEVDSSVPSSPGGPPQLTRPPEVDGWPANVTGVAYFRSTRDAAQLYVAGTAGGAPDNRPVMVIRFTGEFSVYHSVPSGVRPYSTGSSMTADLDSSTGEVLDFGIRTDTPTPIPRSATVLLSR
jgi:hypothetical protein